MLLFSHLVVSDPLLPHGLNRLLCPWHSPGKNTGLRSHFLLQGQLPDPGIEPMSPALVGEFFTTEPSGKPHNSKAIVQGSFPFQA